VRCLGVRTGRTWLTVLLVAGTALLPSCDRSATTEEDGPTPSVGEPATASFRFNVRDREVVPTDGEHVSKRERRLAREAADEVQSLVTDLYVGAFLDPETWSSGTYDGLFEIFAGDARAEARRRTGILTAGENAGDRFDVIDAVGSRLVLRILLDRGGTPILVSSKVGFRARASGDERTLIQSEGWFLFRRMGGAWRIVSFDVERADREGGTA
jgi:hypothetical protein